MNLSKKLNYFRTGLVLVTALLLLNLFTASSFSQTGGAGNAGGVTMVAVSGKVVETMDGGGYTYALVDKDGAKIWVAMGKTRLAVGNEITCRPGMVMNNFRSTALNRSFKRIVFSSGVASFSGAAATPAATPVPEVTPAPEETPRVPKIKEPENWKDF